MYGRILKKPCYLLIVNTSGSLKKFLFFAGWQLSLCGSLLKSADGKQLSIVKVTAKILLLQLISVRMFLCSLIYIFSMENKDQGIYNLYVMAKVHKYLCCCFCPVLLLVVFELKF